VAVRRREHERRLVVLVHGDAFVFVAGVEEHAADVKMAQGAGEVKRGVGQAGGAPVGVVEEVGVGF
jgi:hypothetical protein